MATQRKRPRTASPSREPTKFRKLHKEIQQNEPLSLLDLSAQCVAANIPFQHVEEQGTPIPEPVQLKVVYWSFPRNERDICMYSSLHATVSHNDAKRLPFQRGLALLEENAVRDVLQVGFQLSGKVVEEEDTKYGAQKEEYNVSVGFDRCKITEVSCTCGNKDILWCPHVVALALYRIRNPEKVTLRVPISETLLQMNREQLQKLLQYLITEHHTEVLPTAQRLADEILLKTSEINRLPGAPDPTAGAGADDESCWHLDAEQVRQQVRNYLSQGGYYGSGKHLLSMFAKVREMLRVHDNNGSRMLRLITEQFLADPRLQIWKEQGTSMNDKCRQLWDQLGALWVCVVLNPDSTCAEKAAWKQQLETWSRQEVCPLENPDAQLADEIDNVADEMCTRRTVFSRAMHACDLDWEDHILRCLIGREGQDKDIECLTWKEDVPMAAARVDALRAHGYPQEALRLAVAVARGMKEEQLEKVYEMEALLEKFSEDDIAEKLCDESTERDGFIEGWIGHQLDPIVVLYDTLIEEAIGPQDSESEFEGSTECNEVKNVTNVPLPECGNGNDTFLTLALEVALMGLGQQRSIPVGFYAQDKACRQEEHLIAQLNLLTFDNVLYPVLKTQTELLLKSGPFSSLGLGVQKNSIPMHTFARFLFSNLMQKDLHLAFDLGLRAMRFLALDDFPGDIADEEIPVVGHARSTRLYTLGHLQSQQCELASRLLNAAKDSSERLPAILQASQQHVHSATQLFRLAQDAFKLSTDQASETRDPDMLHFAMELGLKVLQMTLNAHNWRRRDMVQWVIECAVESGTSALSHIMKGWSTLFTPTEATSQVATAVMAPSTAEFSLVRPGTVHSLVSSILKVGRPEVAENFLEMLEADKRTQRSLSSTLKLRKLILGKFAAHGKVDKVKSILSKLEGDEYVSAANLAIRGFLEGRHTTVALQHLNELTNGGSQVQAATVSAMLASSNKDFPISNVLEALRGIELPADAAAAVMGACLKREDIETARTLETRLREHGQLSFAVLEPLLKLMAKHDEASSFGLLQEMVDRKFFLSEGFCGLLLSRCGEAHHIQFAEAVQKYLRERKMTSLATYKTLMKVYATSDNLSRACDLYYDVIEDGIVPDTVMYGCLVKFAVKCGRDDLSELLFNAALEKPQGNDVQNYMWLIRSAGQKHDVPRAVGLLRNLQQQVEYVDASVYNCVLDVCMNNAETELAETIFQEMVQKEVVTLVTYNTLLKGHSAQGKFERAKMLIQEMKAKGFSPNGASFNCLISAAVSAGRFQQAWTFYEDMLNCNISADSFTVCILLKIVRKAPHRPEAQRALAVLDNSKVDICKDEVLLNSVLDACIHLKDNRRLASVLRKFERATLKPSVTNYGLLIKAYACMKQINKCWTIWHEMTDKHQRGLIPSDVALSCMLDAIVTSGQVEEAVRLFEQWQTVVPPNTIIFSNLIKGFASQGDAERAMKMYERLKSHGLTMNLVAYSTLIDAQARAGNIEKAHALLEQMEKDGVKPNTVTYSSLVKGHCLKGDLDGALQVFHMMVAKGVKADTVMYNTILDGAVRASRFALCDQLIQEISQSGTDVSNFTLSIMVKMWGKRRQLEKAFAEVRKYSKAGTMQLDSKLCTCLISACFHNGAPEKALQALQEVKSLPNCDGLDVGTYEQLIEQLVKVRQSQEAACVALEATSLAADGSIKPLSASALRQLQRHLVQSGHSHLWNKLKDELQDSQLPTP